jgi:hypothetical protein
MMVYHSDQLSYSWKHYAKKLKIDRQEPTRNRRGPQVFRNGYAIHVPQVATRVLFLLQTWWLIGHEYDSWSLW